MAGDIKTTQSPDRELPWYALKVRARCEPVAAEALRIRGYDPFCPTYQERRRYCDRMKVVDNVAFPGYLFCRFDPRNRLHVISSQWIEYIVTSGGKPAQIPDEQIASIRRAVAAGARPAPYFKTGQRVRVEYGALAGVEGVLASDSSAGRLIVSIDLLQRSVVLHIDEDHIRLV